MVDKTCVGCKGVFSHPEEILSYKNSGYYCHTCAKDHLTLCNHCKGRRRETWEMTDGSVICRECLDGLQNKTGRSAKICNHCGKVHMGGLTNDQFEMYHKVLPNKNICDICFNEFTENVQPETPGNCLVCGRTTYRGIEKDGKKIPVCDSHRSELKECEHCGELNGRQFFGRARRGDSKPYHVCHSCIEKKGYFSCVGCGYLHPPEENTGDLICKTCREDMSECHVCHTKTFRRNMRSYDVHGKIVYVCGPCSKTLNICDSCGDLKSECHEVTYPDISGLICQDCRHENGWATLHTWRYKASKFNQYGTGPIYFGIENEFSVGEHNRSAAMKHIAKTFHESVLYQQHDGTVDNGAEIVVHPMSFDVIRNDELGLSNMFHRHMIKSDSTGMHVHMTREAFSPMHLFKFMYFISLNPQLTEYIAERPAGRASQYLITHPDLLMEKAKGGRVDPHKYVDVNLQHGPSIELRIFAGVVDFPSLLKNIEFCHALYEFSRDAHRDDAFKVTKFIEHVESSKLYPNLTSFLGKAPKMALRNSCPDKVAESSFTVGSAVKLRDNYVGVGLLHGGSLRAPYHGIIRQQHHRQRNDAGYRSFLVRFAVGTGYQNMVMSEHELELVGRS